MRRVAAGVIAFALAAAVACAPGAGPGTPPAGGLSAVAEDQGLTVLASVAAASFSPAGAAPEVQVKVVNAGKTPVRYIKYGGCDDGFQVWLEQNGHRSGYFEEKVTGPPRACTDAIEFADLAPGASVSATYVYQAVPDLPPPSAGEHMLKVAFSRGLSADAPKPVVVQLKLTVQSGRP